MHCKLEEICSDSLPFPSRVQQDSFTFATGNLHILRICLGANTLTCSVCHFTGGRLSDVEVEVPTRRRGLFQGIRPSTVKKCSMCLMTGKVLSTICKNKQEKKTVYE